MKYNTSLRIWINRVLMIAFLLSLLLGFFETNYFIYAALISLIVGPFQLFSFLITFSFNTNSSNKNKSYLIIYITSVLLYFFGVYLILIVLEIKLNNNIIKYIYYFIPVFLSFFWTFIIESINKKA